MAGVYSYINLSPIYKSSLIKVVTLEIKRRGMVKFAKLPVYIGWCNASIVSYEAGDIFWGDVV